MHAMGRNVQVHCTCSNTLVVLGAQVCNERWRSVPQPPTDKRADVAVFD